MFHYLLLLRAPPIYSSMAFEFLFVLTKFPFIRETKGNESEVSGLLIYEKENFVIRSTL